MPPFSELGITPETIRTYDRRIPRYTSYPTAPTWTTEFGPGEWSHHISQTSAESGDLALYVHIPFCAKRCSFCACNVIITRQAGIASRYLDFLEKEVAIISRLWRGMGKVVQLHLGGGTPNYLSADETTRLMAILGNHFPFSPEAEKSIEIDPRLATDEEIHTLAARHGFRRISFGVQDFSDETQKAIGREQARKATFSNVRAAREAGFESINIDLIYGLPAQVRDSWASSLDSVVELAPDRVALYNFAFLPALMAHQRAMNNMPMPGPSEKMEMFMMAHERLSAAGWDFIGMDHYARHDDSLAVAQRGGTLHRNFMGYTVLRGTDMLAFGVSAISDFQSAFSQNVKKLSRYENLLAEGILPVERGRLLSADDRLRRFAIEEIMCNGRLSFDGENGASIRRLVDDAHPVLEPLESDGLVTLTASGLTVTPRGRFFLRNIASAFDAWLGRSVKPFFSRAV